jgi:hypothetical protein
MAFLKTTYTCFLKRPSLLIYSAVVAFLYSLIQIFNPVTGFLQNMGVSQSEKWTDSMIYISKEIYSLSNLAYLIPLFLLAAVLLATVTGLVTSGFMNLYYETLEGSREKTFPLILEGLKKGFIKVSIVYVEFYIAVTAIILLIPLASVPAIILKQKAVENASSNIFINEILPIMTIAVIFLALAMVAMAFIFRFPSLFFFKKRPIGKSKNVISTAYWRHFAGVAMILAMFIGNEIMLLGFDSIFWEMVVGWIIRTILFIATGALAFSGYYVMLQKFRKN